MAIEVKCSVPAYLVARSGEPKPTEIEVISVDGHEDRVCLKIDGKTVNVDGPDLMTAIRNALRNE